MYIVCQTFRSAVGETRIRDLSVASPTLCQFTHLLLQVCELAQFTHFLSLPVKQAKIENRTWFVDNKRFCCGPVFVACICVVITGLSYLITQQLTDYYTKTRHHSTSKVLVQFDVGFYIITSASAMSIIGVACTLMRRVRRSSSRRRCVSSDRRRLNADIERLAAAASVTCPPPGCTLPPYRR